MEDVIFRSSQGSGLRLSWRTEGIRNHIRGPAPPRLNNSNFIPYHPGNLSRGGEGGGCVFNARGKSYPNVGVVGTRSPSQVKVL